MRKNWVWLADELRPVEHHDEPRGRSEWSMETLVDGAFKIGLVVVIVHFLAKAW